MESDLKVIEVAKLLQVTNQTVQTWIRTGDLKAYRLPGGAYRVPPAELVRLRMSSPQAIKGQ